MSKIPFKVSARTARLIGRENIASSKGAIIELVKNSSDADSKVCVIYFDNRYATLPSEMTTTEFSRLISSNVPENVLNEAYSGKGNKYVVNKDLSDEFKKYALSYL